MDVTCTVITRRRLLRIAASLMPVSSAASAQNLVAALEHATIGAITEIDDEHDRPFNPQGEASSIGPVVIGRAGAARGGSPIIYPPIGRMPSPSS